MRSRWALVALALMGCGIIGPDSTTRSFEVAPYKSTCTGLFATLCLQVREPGESSFGNTFQTPSGFDFEWGVRYLIVVEDTPVENPPADGSSIRRRLRRVVEQSREPAGSVFEIPVPGEGLAREGAAVLRLFHGGESVRCAVVSDCDTLDALADSGWVALTMSYPEQPGGPLRLVAFRDCGPTPFCLD